MSIFKKILLLVAATAACLAVALTSIGSWLLSSMGDISSRQQLTISQTAMQREVDSALQVQGTFADIIEKGGIISKAVAAKDHAAVRAFGQSLVAGPLIDLVTICDTEGRVIARGHSDKRDDLLGARRLSSHIPLTTGKRITGIEPGNVVKLTLATGLPIMHEGKLVGAAIIGVDLSSGAFLQKIKQTLGVECTLFQGDERVATTISHSGKSLVGTKLANTGILDLVIGKGQEYQDRNVISGMGYDTAYWPWKDMIGKNGGMFFVGVSRKVATEMQQKAMLMLAGAALAIMLTMLGIGYAVARAIAGPIKATTEYAQAVAGGDLDRTFSVSSRDEVGVLAKALGTMVANLKVKIAESDAKSHEAEIQARKALEAMTEAGKSKEKAEAGQVAILQAAGEVEQVVHRLSTAAEELSAQVETSSRSAVSQQEQVTGSATAMEEMNATVLEVARSSGQAAEGAERARENAEQGAAVMRRSVDAITKVQRDTETLREEMNRLGQQAEGIGAVMSVINDVADQTNLLALNAAIEAARAGEAGRGFAVVADEVRKLAERTMEATKEVASAITGIQQSARESIHGVETTGANLEDATALIAESGEALTRIVSESEHVADQVRSIATAAEEQSATSEEITRTLDSINAASTETATAMQESSQAVSELAAQTQELKRLVEGLRKGGQ